MSAATSSSGLSARRLVFEHARRNERVRRNFDGLGIALVLDGIVGEQRRQELGIREGRRCLAVLRHPVAGLDVELVLVGRGLEAVGLLVNGVGEALGHFRILLRGALRA